MPGGFELAAGKLQEWTQSGRIPGGALGLVEANGRIQSYFCGNARELPGPEVLQPGHYFDLASLTKVLFTLPEILKLVEEGMADLYDPLQKFLPELGWLSDSWLQRVSLYSLLAHETGLPAWYPLYTLGLEAKTLKAWILQHPWQREKPVYSDLGYIFLGLVLERIRGQDLADFALPQGMSFTPPPLLSVATEDCPWRGRVLQGEVHDENACALGGAAGHAGLFGTLEGVLNALAGYLQNRALSPASLELLRRPTSPERALGWEIAHPGWSGGSLCSRQTLGHTGFTGTGAWIDLERGYGWCLLTGRVHPSRHRPSGIKELRQAVGNILAAGC